MYKRAFNDVAIVPCDIGKLHPSIVQEFLNEYKNQGAKTVVITGNLRNKRGKTKEIRVRYYKNEIVV